MAVAQPCDKDYDLLMAEYGLVDVTTLCDDLFVELRYSTENNFVGRDMYGSLERAYFEPSFAQRIVAAAEELRRRNPELRLLIYDAARPLSVQRTMRRMVEGTSLERFVADGTRGGRHNYGVAVDVTLARLDGTPLDMGAAFDDFTEAAAVKGTPDTAEAASRRPEVYRSYLQTLLNKGVISREALDNRMLLIEVMHAVGLYPYRREWWHFEELMPMSETRAKYRLLEF